MLGAALTVSHERKINAQTPKRCVYLAKGPLGVIVAEADAAISSNESSELPYCRCPAAREMCPEN
jgi:hypothetical protein